MDKPTIEFCEDKDKNSSNYNIYSNIFIILGGIYGFVRNHNYLFGLTELAFIIVGLGSMYFHYSKDYFSQLFDELPMSILIIFYVLLVNNTLVNNRKKYLEYSFIIFTAIGWIFYLGIRKFIIFEVLFTLQIVFLIILLLMNYKTNKQLKLIVSAIIILGISKLLWNYEQFLVKTDQCPKNKTSFSYYLHSYWHIGIALAHILLKHCLRSVISR